MLRILKILISLLVFVVLVDPGDKIFHLKMVLFVSIFLVWPFTFKRYLKYHLNTILLSLIVGICIPAFSFFIGIFFSETFVMKYGIMYFKAYLFFLLLIVTIHSEVDIGKNLIKNSVFVALLTIVLYYIMLFYNNSLYTFVAIFFDKNDAAFTFLPWSQRQYGPFIVKILFYKTSPVLVFPLAYYLFVIFGDRKEINKKLVAILILLFFSALLISGTRANILSACLLVLINFFNYVYRKEKVYLKILVVFPIIMLIVFVLVPFVISAFFDAQEYSNQVKYEHFTSYIELFKNNFVSLIAGQGIGSEFYSYGIHRYTHQTELTYLELIRMLGLPLALTFFIVLLLPFYIYYIYRNDQSMVEKKYLIQAYVFYLFIIGTNPLLLGSTGMLVLVCVFTDVLRIKHAIATKRVETIKTILNEPR